MKINKYIKRNAAATVILFVVLLITSVFSAGCFADSETNIDSPQNGVESEKEPFKEPDAETFDPLPETEPESENIPTGATEKGSGGEPKESETDKKKCASGVWENDDGTEITIVSEEGTLTYLGHRFVLIDLDGKTFFTCKETIYWFNFDASSDTVTITYTFYDIMTGIFMQAEEVFARQAKLPNEKSASVHFGSFNGLEYCGKNI